MDNENARLRAARNAMVRTCTTTGGPSHEGERWVHWADYQALMDAVDAALTPAPEAPKGGEGGCPFCGCGDVATEIDHEQGDKWGYAACEQCGSRGPEVRTSYDASNAAPWRADALKEWNRRATPAPGADFKAGMLRAADVLGGITKPAIPPYNEGSPFFSAFDMGQVAAVERFKAAIRAEAEKITSSDAGGGAQPDMRALGMEG